MHGDYNVSFQGTVSYSASGVVIYWAPFSIKTTRIQAGMNAVARLSCWVLFLASGLGEFLYPSSGTNKKIYLASEYAR